MRHCCHFEIAIIKNLGLIFYIIAVIIALRTAAEECVTDIFATNHMEIYDPNILNQVKVTGIGRPRHNIYTTFSEVVIDHIGCMILSIILSQDPIPFRKAHNRHWHMEEGRPPESFDRHVSSNSL